MKLYIIYCHKNRTTNKQYVGYTSTSLTKRWSAHLKLVRSGSKLKFHNSIRKHGVDVWDHVVLCARIRTLADAKRLEKLFIKKFRTFEDGYNMTLGGDGCPPGSQKGRKFSNEHREKLRLAKLGKKTGRKIPPQMAEARRGLKASEETRKKISAAVKRRESESQETRQKRSETMKRVWAERKSY
jgi:group I intron endonuclease